MGKNLKHYDKELQYQPFHDSLERIHSMCASKNIARPFSENGYDAVMGSEALTNAMLTELASNFKGEENLREAFLSITKHDIRDYHKNKGLGKYVDENGNTMSAEGLGAAAPVGGYNYFDRLNPVMTAGYIARARSIEFYHVIHDDKPTFWREYNVQTAIVDGVEYPLPQAIRDGVLKGALDLPLCQPKIAVGSPHIKKLKDVVTNKEMVMISTGSKGNLMAEAGIPPSRFALEKACSIDYIAVELADAKTPGIQIFRKDINRKHTEGKTSEREFSDKVIIKYVNNADKLVVKELEIMAKIDLDTGEYSIFTAGTNDPVKGVHIKVRLTNIPNEMSTVSGGNHKWHISFDVENKRYASTPIIPEMEADFNAGGEGVTWVAFMTQQLTEAISGIRNIDLEEEIFDSFSRDKEDFEMYKKLGGYKYKGPFTIAQRYPGGSDDYLGPTRTALREFLYTIFTRAEKELQFDNEIPRQWIVMGNDEDTRHFMENPTKNDTAANFGSEHTSFRYGFSCDDAYGFSDTQDRRVRVIGSRDNRWVGQPLTAVLKSTSIAAPTTIYFPYSVKVMSGISPEFGNRAAMLFSMRDAKRVSTMAQARFELLGNDENLYSKIATFASGFPRSGQPD